MGRMRRNYIRLSQNAMNYASNSTNNSQLDNGISFPNLKQSEQPKEPFGHNKYKDSFNAANELNKGCFKSTLPQAYNSQNQYKDFTTKGSSILSRHPNISSNLLKNQADDVNYLSDMPKSNSVQDSIVPKTEHRPDKAVGLTDTLLSSTTKKKLSGNDISLETKDIFEVTPPNNNTNVSESQIELRNTPSLENNNVTQSGFTPHETKSATTLSLQPNAEKQHSAPFSEDKEFFAQTAHLPDEVNIIDTAESTKPNLQSNSTTIPSHITEANAIFAQDNNSINHSKSQTKPANRLSDFSKEKYLEKAFKVDSPSADELNSTNNKDSLLSWFYKPTTQNDFASDNYESPQNFPALPINTSSSNNDIFSRPLPFKSTQPELLTKHPNLATSNVSDNTNYKVKFILVFAVLVSMLCLITLYMKYYKKMKIEGRSKLYKLCNVALIIAAFFNIHNLLRLFQQPTPTFVDNYYLSYKGFVGTTLGTSGAYLVDKFLGIAKKAKVYICEY